MAQPTGERLKDLYEAHGLSQTQLAARCGVDHGGPDGDGGGHGRGGGGGGDAVDGVLDCAGGGAGVTRSVGTDVPTREGAQERTETRFLRETEFLFWGAWARVGGDEWE